MTNKQKKAAAELRAAHRAYLAAKSALYEAHGRAIELGLHVRFDAYNIATDQLDALSILGEA